MFTSGHLQHNYAVTYARLQQPAPVLLFVRHIESIEASSERLI